MTEPFARGLVVRLFDWVYRPKGTVPDYVSCSVTWQELAAGPGELVVDEADPKAPLIMQSDLRPLMAVVDFAGQRWSGRVSSFNLHREGPPGSGTVTASLVQDWVWLLYMLASQNGVNPSLSGMPQYDTRTGPAATVAAYYINAAATRLAVPVVAVLPQVDTSPSITVNARMTPLADLLAGPLADAGVSVPGSIWLPGDPQPAGLALDRPTVVFSPQLRPAKPWLQWADNGAITKVDLTGTASTAYRAVLGLDGQDAARVYDQVIDPDLAAEQGDYALPEAYKDEPSVAAGADSQTAGRVDLIDHRPKAAAALEVVDGRPWRFGKHYVVGDTARSTIAGIPIAQRVSKVTVSDDRPNGLTTTPVIGDPQAAATNDEQMVAAIASIAQQVRAIQAGG